MSVGPQAPIPLRFKVSRRFYGPLVLLESLRSVHKISGSTAPALEAAPDTSHTGSHVLRQFINKLGHVCDSDKGGHSVTASVILQLEGGIEYVFASNMRNAVDIEQCKVYMKDLLDCLGAMSLEGNATERDVSMLLHKVLVFVRKRVLGYVKKILEQAELCITSCNAALDNIVADIQARDAIRRLVSLAESVMSAKEDLAAFPVASEALIRDIQEIYEGPLEGFSSRCRHGNSCWAELQHANGRLLSYLYAIDILIRARKTWEQLFQEFTIRGLPSGTPIINPFSERNGAKKRGSLKKSNRRDSTAEAIIGRMTSDQEIMEARRGEAAALQVHQLDTRIQESINKASFRPIVHAEVNVSDWLVRNNYTHPSNFFQGEKYIGCSKPTCSLCQHYFNVLPDGFKVRPGHGNLYISWRTPDVFSAQEEVRRSRIIDDMLALIRTETFRAITDNFSVRKTHDSNTNPTRDMYQTIADESVLGEFDVLSEFETADLSLYTKVSPSSSDSLEEGLLTQIVRPPEVAKEKKKDDSDDGEEDDEDGGVRI